MDFLKVEGKGYPEITVSMEGDSKLGGGRRVFRGEGVPAKFWGVVSLNF